MKTSRQIRQEAKRVFRLCLVNGRLDGDRTRQAVKRVLDDKRRGYLTLLGEFQRLVKLELGRHAAEIQSAIPLEVDLRGRIHANLESLYGSGLEVQVVYRPDLIGGIRVTVGSDVYDGSVRFRLAELTRAFSATGGNGRNL